MAKNYNYISIKMKNINVTVNRNLLTVGYSTLQQLDVSARQHKEVTKLYHNSNNFITVYR